MRDNCLAEFDAHWKCLEMNNQVILLVNYEGINIANSSQYFQACRQPERSLNQCVFDKLVSSHVMSDAWC